MTDTPRRAAAKQFAADWQGKGYEKGHSQTFWLSLLQKGLRRRKTEQVHHV